MELFLIKYFSLCLSLGIVSCYGSALTDALSFVHPNPHESFDRYRSNSVTCAHRFDLDLICPRCHVAVRTTQLLAMAPINDGSHHAHHWMPLGHVSWCVATGPPYGHHQWATLVALCVPFFVMFYPIHSINPSFRFAISVVFDQFIQMALI